MITVIIDRKKIKSQVHKFLVKADSPYRTRIDLFLAIVVIVTVAMVIQESDSNLDAADKLLYHQLELLCNILFLFEYLLRWWAASDLISSWQYAYHRHRRRHQTSNLASIWRATRYSWAHKWFWMKQPMAIIDLLAWLPLLPFFHESSLLRILCLLKLLRYTRQSAIIKTALQGHAQEIASVLIIAAVSWSLVAIAFYVVEYGHNPRLHTLWDAYYWMVVTVATLGYGDIVPHTMAGQGVVMAGTVVGIITTTFISVVLISAMTEHLIHLRETRMEQRISQLSEHYIVCGLSDMGRIVCANLQAEKKPFVGLDHRQDRVEAAIREGWAASQGLLQDEQTWKPLNVSSARGVIITTNDEATNISIVLIVREISPYCTIVACSTTPSAEKRLLKLGATRVVSPSQIGGLQLTHSALRPTALHFLDLVMKTDYAELEMEEIPLPLQSPFANLTLHNTRIRSDFNVIVVGILPSKDKMIFNPRGDVMIRPGDTLVCLGNADDMQRLREAINNNVVW
ncbi:NAD-binding protein [Candidatus Magnetaquicoccus inordinatus]|uniref:NAD-binding protein n=1 Tax=Candidatus Magnetaquicoccus inordinatus TaxID=2496818 RepID=UPI00102D1D50|nr:NAD-binding protein [Candidatus Magnetaquicoccus inordinatus]